MNSIIYLGQVTACTAVFYLFYYLFLRKLTFFSINRWYLLSTVILSFLIPLIKLDINQPKPYTGVVEQVVYTYAPQQAEPPVIISTTKPLVAEHPMTWKDALRLIYFAAVAALTIHLLITLLAFFKKIKGKRITRLGHVNILSGNNKISNGSFLNYIFVNEDELSADEVRQIIAHEMTHVRLYHSVDRIIVKLAQIVLWFDPFIYLYARSVEENHEFEVDRSVANDTDKQNYANLLLHLSVAGNGMLYHNFSKVPLKKRITMLFIKPTTNMKKVIYLLFVPVVLISVVAFASLKKNEKSKMVAGKTISTAEPLILKEFKKTEYYKRALILAGKVIKVNVENVDIENDRTLSIAVSHQADYYVIAHYNLPANVKFKRGDELTIKVKTFIISFETVGKGIDQKIAVPLELKPEQIYKNGELIFSKKDGDNESSVDHQSEQKVKNIVQAVDTSKRKASVKKTAAPVTAEPDKQTLQDIFKRTKVNATTDDVEIKFGNGSLSSQIPHGSKVGFYIDNVLYTEGQLKSILKEKIAGRAAIVTGADNFKRKIAPEYKGDLNGYGAVFIFKVKDQLPAEMQNKIGEVSSKPDVQKNNDTEDIRQKITITSDSISHNGKHVTEYYGNVNLKYDGFSIIADHVRIDDDSKRIFASSVPNKVDGKRKRLIFQSSNAKLVSDSLTFDYNTKMMKVWNGANYGTISYPK